MGVFSYPFNFIIKNMIFIKPVLNSIENINILFSIIKESAIEDSKIWNLLFEIDEVNNESIDTYIESKKYKNFFLLLLNDKVIWYVKISFLKNKRISHRYSIWPFYISFDHRWKWYSEKFFELLIDYIIKNTNDSFYNIVLSVNIFNSKAINLYKKLWFEIIWIEKAHIYFEWNYISVYNMQKIIIR